MLNTVETLDLVNACERCIAPYCILISFPSRMAKADDLVQISYVHLKRKINCVFKTSLNSLCETRTDLDKYLQHFSSEDNIFMLIELQRSPRLNSL